MNFSSSDYKSYRKNISLKLIAISFCSRSLAKCGFSPETSKVKQFQKGFCAAENGLLEIITDFSEKSDRFGSMSQFI